MARRPVPVRPDALIRDDHRKATQRMQLPQGKPRLDSHGPDAQHPQLGVRRRALGAPRHDIDTLGHLVQHGLRRDGLLTEEQSAPHQLHPHIAGLATQQLPDPGSAIDQVRAAGDARPHDDMPHHRGGLPSFAIFTTVLHFSGLRRPGVFVAKPSLIPRQKFFNPSRLRIRISVAPVQRPM